MAAGKEPALAERREFAAGDHILRFGGGIDVRDTHALRAAVEGAVDQALVVCIDADDGGQAPDVAGAGEVAQVGRVDRTVLTFEPHAVETAGTEGINIVGIGHTDGNIGDVTGRQFAFYAIGSEFYYHPQAQSGCASSVRRKGMSICSP